MLSKLKEGIKTLRVNPTLMTFVIGLGITMSVAFGLSMFETGGLTGHTVEAAINTKIRSGPR